MIKSEKRKEAVFSFDTKAYVLVVGAGGAGLAAGVSAYENGAKSVIILEKMQFLKINEIQGENRYF